LVQDVRIDRTTATGRQPLSRRLLLKILDTCTQYTALKAAVSDPECEQVVENLKSEWLNVGRLVCVPVEMPVRNLHLHRECPSYWL
jgi:hypothetical protein